MPRGTFSIRKLAGLVSPAGWLLLAAWGVQQVEPARAAAAPYARIFCFGSLAGAALLSWYYNRSRVVLVAVAIGLTVWGTQQLSASGEVIGLAAVFLLPLNIALFSWLQERSLLTLRGLLNLWVLLAQVLGVVALGELDDPRLEAFLRWGQQPDGWTWLPLTEQLWFAVAALSLLVLVFVRRTRVEGGLLWALGTVFLAFSQAAKPEALLFYSGAAGLILLFAELEHGYEVGYLDELTGLPGRRALNEHLRQLDSNYAIAMCDVDHFKDFNDTYGHEAGDQVLRMVATKLSRVGGGGRVFRYGGEEFTIIFTGRSAEEAERFAESLCEAVAESGFVLRAPDRPKKRPERVPHGISKASVPITISIGVAEHGKKHSTPPMVLDAADNALYLAKAAGRNCVRLA